MTVRFCGFKSGSTGGLLAAAAVLGCCAAPSYAGGPAALAAPAVRSSGLVKVGGGSSPLPGLPSIKIEVPSPTGGAPVAEVGVSEKGVTVTTPVTPKVEVPVPTVEVPAPKVEVPSPKVEVPSPTAPVNPTSTVEKVTNPSGGSGGGSGGSGTTAIAASAGTTTDGAKSTPGATTVSHAGSKAASRAHNAADGVRSGAGSGGRGPARLGPAAAAAAGIGGTPAVRHAHHSSSDPLASIGSSLPLPLPVPDWSKPIILLLAILVIALGVRWRLATRRAGRLERRQGSLLRDIEVMQAALVPAVPERLEGLAVSVAYRPAEGPAAGGDFYDVFAMGPQRVAVILGDVAGHGHDALRQAALTRYTLRAFLKETGDPRAALALAGHALSEPGVEQLATVAIALFDSARGTLTYALAGHPPPILLGVAAEETPANCSSPPVGCELPTGRRQRTIGLPAGARACFFSDGLIEARLTAASPGGHPDLLGRRRLAEILAGLPEEEGADELLAAIRAEAEATPDDMAACILTSEARGARRAIDIEELEVDGHTIEGGHLEAYLHRSGVAGEEAARVLAAARAQLDAHETAVLAVDRGGPEIEIGVRAGDGHLGGAIRRRAKPGSSRLLRT